MSISVTLSPADRADLAAHEAVIERGLQTFVEVGNALYEIRDRALYRDSHATFDDYCRDRWGFTDRRARQLIAGAAVGTLVPVANEAQARELAPLLRDHGPTAVAEAWASVEDAPVASALREAAAWTAWLIAWRERAGEPALTLSEAHAHLKQLGLAFDDGDVAAVHAALVLDRAPVVLLRTGDIPPPPPSFSASERTRRIEWELWVKRGAGELLLARDVLSGVQPVARLRERWDVPDDWADADILSVAIYRLTDTHNT